MKSICIILLSFIFTPNLYTQNEWQEHLSHDRIAYAHHGHFINASGGLYITIGNQDSPMNTTEAIYGNKKKALLRVHSENNTYDSKSVRININQNQLTLNTPWNQDTPGNGVYSIIQTSTQNINFRKVLDIAGDSLTITDIIFPIFPFDEKYCITSENKWYGLDHSNAVNWVSDIQGNLELHSGLNGESHKISNGAFTSIANPEKGSVELGSYDKLDNNPFQNQLIEFEEATINRYSYDDFSLIGSDILNGIPLDYLFVENGFYYMIESDNNYTVYFFSNENSQSVLYYELSKIDEILDFQISEFDIEENNIFFLGLWNAPHINEPFSYVQKRDISQDYTPVRKDLELTNMVVTHTPTGQNDQIEYEYTCTVTNLSDEAINHFTLYSERLTSIDFAPGHIIKNDFSQELAPGESFEVTGQFIHTPLNSLTFLIAGVDYAIDKNMNNNSFTIDFGTVSNKEILSNEYSIAPNPSSSFISVLGEIQNIQAISIIDILGNRINVEYNNNNNNNRINIKDLLAGQYWLEIRSLTKTEIKSFIKL